MPVTLLSHRTVYNPSNNSHLNFKSTSLTHVTSCTGPHVLTTLTHLFLSVQELGVITTRRLYSDLNLGFDCGWDSKLLTIGAFNRV